MTSRAPLHVSGEQEYEVPPLQVPDPQCATVAAVAGCESVRLFTERAQAVWPGFVLDEENAALIAGIARRLDGLPLAVELAAARVKLLPPASLLARLEHALPVLVGGARDLPQRQQTLRGHDRLELRAARRGRRAPAGGLLGVPRRHQPGGRRVGLRGSDRPGHRGPGRTRGTGRPEPAAPGRGVAGPGGPRFGMLFMVREYAAERLAEMPERARVEEAHAATFLALAEDGRAGAARPRRAGVARPARGRAPEHPRRHRLVPAARAPRRAAAGRGHVPLLGRPRSFHRGAPDG